MADNSYDADQLKSLTLAPEYGYVILVSICFFFLNIAHIARIGVLRSRYNIQPPAMASEEYPDYTCAQRVHANTLEQLPFFLPNLAFGGVRHPIFAAAFGGAYLLGRIIYTIGYWTGKANYRLPGSFIGTFFGLLPLVGVALSSAAGMIGWW